MYQLNEGLIIAVVILPVTGHVCIVGICLLLLTLYYLQQHLNWSFALWNEPDT